MTIYKCKMCGGNLQIEKGTTTCRCIYCDTLQTIAAVDDNKKTELFNRANTLRMNREFDRAAGVYESIIKDCPEEAEAYWGMVLCKYGILYVDDPGTGKKIPTCNRTSYVSIFDDADYKLTEKFSDPSALSVYRQEAQKIDDIQKGILNIVRLEAPYDIFISYKEKDHGERTEDSVLGQEIYEELTARGYRVFFSMISLEGKLGTEYEPYIYAALNSSKVMLALGTTPEHYNAVWVKNEWSRYLTLMEKDRNKTLIAVFKGMTPSDLPVELQGIQGQDMSKIGAMQDLLRGIDKILGKDRMHLNLQDEDKYVNTGYVNIQSLLQRGKIALEDRDWNKAESFYEQVLNNDAENGDAYIGKMLISFKVSSFDELFNLIGKDDLQSLEHYEIKHACTPDMDHIKRPVNENIVPECVNNYSLYKLYEFNDSYQSRVAAARRHRTKMLSKYDGNKNIRRAMQYAKGEAKADLEKRMKAWKDNLDKAIKIAEEEDRNKEKQIREAYEHHMKKADEEASFMKTHIEAIDKELEERQLELKKLSVFNLKNKKELNDRIISLKKEKNNIRKKNESIKKQVYIESLHYSWLKEIKEKGTVSFGRLNENGVEKPLEWFVTKEKDRTLLFCKDIVATKAYGKNEKVTWENSPIRLWLNEEFINQSFNKDEKELILSTEHNDRHSLSAVWDERYIKTIDKIFVLKAEEYFDVKFDPDTHTLRKEFVGENIGAYWLRGDGNSLQCVDSQGELHRKNRYDDVDIYIWSKIGVRPALYVNIDLLNSDS